jgi:hypothetical protein
MLIPFVLYSKNYKRWMLSLNSKHVQHVKIYLPCNFEVNLIIQLEVICCFRAEDWFNIIANQKKRIALGGHICWWDGTKWRNLIEDLT